MLLLLLSFFSFMQLSISAFNGLNNLPQHSWSRVVELLVSFGTAKTSKYRNRVAVCVYFVVKFFIPLFLFAFVFAFNSFHRIYQHRVL
jgi:hypothetical protein